MWAELLQAWLPRVSRQAAYHVSPYQHTHQALSHRFTAVPVNSAHRWRWAWAACHVSIVRHWPASTLRGWSLCSAFYWLLHTRVIPDFGSGSGRSSAAAIFSNFTDKTNAAYLWLWCGVFEILTSVTPTIKIQNPLPLHTFRQKQWRNKGSSELYCLFVAADSIVDARSFIRSIVLWSANKFFPIQIWLWIWNSPICYNPITHTHSEVGFRCVCEYIRT